MIFEFEIFEIIVFPLSFGGRVFSFRILNLKLGGSGFSLKFLKYCHYLTIFSVFKSIDFDFFKGMSLPRR